MKNLIRKKYTQRAVFAAITGVAFVLHPLAANATPAGLPEPSSINESSDFDQSMVVLDHYVQLDASGNKRFDSAAAEADGASPYLLEAGERYNEVSQDHGTLENEGYGQTRGMPGYGNWCGPGNSGPGAPINTIDRLCQKHDRCYADRGYFACSCDRALIEDIKANRGNFKGAGENAASLAIATYFNSALCNPLK